MSRVTAEESWVIDGNYSDVRDIIWRKADTLIWLDLPFLTLFYRILWRTLRRVVKREKLWNDNTEGLDALFGSNSMPLWVIKTYWRRKREYPVLLSKPEYSHLNIIRLETDQEINDWLEILRKP